MPRGVVAVAMQQGVVADASGQPGGCTPAADRASVVSTLTTPLGPDGATAAARQMSGGRSVGYAQAQVTSWTRRIPITVEAGAPGNATLTGGTATVAYRTPDPRPGDDTASWVVRTSASSGGGKDKGHDNGRPGLLARTGTGDSLPVLLWLVGLAVAAGTTLLGVARRARREAVR